MEKVGQSLDYYPNGSGLRLSYIFSLAHWPTVEKGGRYQGVVCLVMLIRVYTSTPVNQIRDTISRLSVGLDTLCSGPRLRLSYICCHAQLEQI